MLRRFKSVGGFVLAGGASLRMGHPKTDLMLSGEPMLERQIRLLRSVCGAVAVVGKPHSGLYAAISPASACDLTLDRALNQAASPRPQSMADVPFFPDDVPGRGPLGGIYTGLRVSRSEFSLFLACDLPFMKVEFLRYLCRRALATRADVTVPETHQHGFHTLCAVYRRRARKAVRASLEAGENKVSEFFSRVHCEVLSEREILLAGFRMGIFDNINTPQEYESALRRAKTFSPRSFVPGAVSCEGDLRDREHETKDK